MHLCVAGGERGWAGGEVGGYSPPAPSPSPSEGKWEQGCLGLLTGAQSPLSQLPRALLGLLPWLSLSAPPHSPALCDYNGLCAGPRSAPLPAPPACAHAHACAHAARGLPLYIMQPPYRLRRHRAGGAPAASYLPLLDAVRKAWQSLG